jgi:hypothetical protein
MIAFERQQMHVISRSRIDIVDQQQSTVVRPVVDVSDAR